MPILETERVVLREFVPGDADALTRILSDPETMRYYPAPLDHDGVVAWIDRNRARYEKDGHGLWAMILKSSGELIGDCGISMQEVQGAWYREIGYHVRRDLWGQGLAAEAARACRDYGFANLRAETLISIIRPENLPSRRVAEKNGMTLWKICEYRGLPHCIYRIEKSESTK
ncbi:MAG TPA: GNAT family N-acetyltransferase [Terriglobales bacterium]|nr:GNAT family N-acetyltransferase [Terriglobales bacterium]